jgi:hypothetical protein
MLRRFILAALIALLAGGSAGATAETDWAALFIREKKSGHVKFVRQVEDGVVTTSQDMTISVPRAGVPLVVKTSTTSRESAHGEPLGFEVTQDLGGKPKHMVGRVEDGKIHVTVTSAGSKSERTLDWPEGALMTEAARQLMLEKGLERGTKYEFKQFVPDNLAAFDVAVTVGQKEEIDLLGRVAELTRVETAMDVYGWNVNAVSWVDDEFNVLLMKMPMMMMEIKLVACPKEYALSPNEPGEFFQSMLTTVPSDPPGGGLREGLIWLLAPKQDIEQKLKLPETTEQSVERHDDGKLAVTVRPRKMPRGVALPYAGDDEVALAALKPSDWVQSGEPAIKKLATEAMGDARDAATAARRIEIFVEKHINDKNLSVGYASALEVAGSREGDCTEHAVLVAALCKASGIPARVAVGLAYAEGFAGRRRVLVPHAWAQVWLKGNWYSLDAALGEFSAGHILLDAGQGEPVDFMGAAMTLGGLKVEGVAPAD